jgi:hypothetical protein
MLPEAISWVKAEERDADHTLSSIDEGKNG